MGPRGIGGKHTERTDITTRNLGMRCLVETDGSDAPCTCLLVGRMIRPSQNRFRASRSKVPFPPPPRLRSTCVLGSRAQSPRLPRANANHRTLTPLYLTGPTATCPRFGRRICPLAHPRCDRPAARKYAQTFSSEQPASTLPTRLAAHCGGSFGTRTQPDATLRYAIHPNDDAELQRDAVHLTQ
jgi:hypothetical protein